MFTDQLTQAIATARGGRALDDVSRAVWRGLAEGIVDDEGAQALADAIHAKREAMGLSGRPGAAPGAQGGPAGLRAVFPPRRPQRPPRRALAIERRRRLAASAPLPPALAARFTTGELAVLRIVGDEARDRGACMLPIDAIAARAGVSRTLVKSTIRLAASLGLLTWQERRRPGRPSLPNVVKVISREWRSWANRGSKGGGVRIPTSTDTVSFEKGAEAVETAARNTRTSRWQARERPREGMHRVHAADR